MSKQDTVKIMPINFIVDAEEEGKRFDQILASRYPEFSRSRWQSAIKQGDILLNQAPAKAKITLSEGDQISGNLTLSEETDDAAQNIPLDIVYQDDDIIVINKPAGLVVHPAAGNHDGTLLNALLYHFPENRNLPRAGIVHRLDKDTSGLMVVAHSLRAQTALVEQLQTRAMGREYLALVYGFLTAGDTIDMPIGRSQKDRIKMAVRPDGKPAITHFRIEERFDNLTLIRVKLETGRTHQIRVHMTEIKHPLVGDPVYGNSSRRLPKDVAAEAREAIRQFPRQALHAEKLALIHPASGERCEYYAPLPDDMAQLLATLRTHYTPSSE